MTDQVEYNDYKNRLAEWEAERLRQKYEFTITENDLDADKRIGSPEITVISREIYNNLRYSLKFPQIMVI